VGDTTSGRYPDSEEEWLLDGMPTPPYRRTISRRDITATWQPATTAYLNVFAVPVQAGDIFDYISFAVKTASATQTHAWAALYNGVGTGAALQAQTADVGATVLAASTAYKWQLGSPVSNIGTVGTPQGPSTGVIVPQGPAVWGIAFYVAATTLPVLDGMAGGAVLGEVVVSGQVPIASTGGSIGATATAPSVLPTMTSLAGAVPYLLLSRN